MNNKGIYKKFSNYEKWDKRFVWSKSLYQANLYNFR